MQNIRAKFVPPRSPNVTQHGGRKQDQEAGLQEPGRTCPKTQRQEEFNCDVVAQPVLLLPKHSATASSLKLQLFLLCCLLHHQVFAFFSQKKKKKYNRTSISYITFKVTCIKCTKSTFLLMEWPFVNEVISDITAKKRGVFLSPFLPFLKPSEVANFVAFAVCAQYFNQLYKVMCFLNSYCVC